MNVVNVCASSFDFADSYGRIAFELRRTLERRGVRVNAVGEEDGAPIAPALGGIIMGYPTHHRDYGGMVNAGAKVAVTMFESTALPSGWAGALNECAAVIVPSAWLVDVFKAEGVRTPIHVVPLGVSREFAPMPRQVSEVFTFIAIGDRDERKGWRRAAAAFHTAFGNDLRYKLILKARADGLTFGEGQKLIIQNPNIEIVRADLSNAEMAALYQQCDCMVFPSNGEGFGLPPREFAATGGVAIATAWGGTADEIEEWGIPLEYTMTPAWMNAPQKDIRGLGEWAEPDMGALVELMQRVSNVPLEMRNIFGRSVSAAVRRLYSWEAFSERVLEIWGAACQQPRSARA